MPYGLYVLGSRAGDPRHSMTIHWVTQLAFALKLVGVGVEHEASTHELVTARKIFSRNFIYQNDRAIIRKFVKSAQVDTEK